MIDRDKIPEPTDVINIKEFLDSIWPEDDELMHFVNRKSGEQFVITYKRYMEEKLKGKTEMIFADICKFNEDVVKAQCISFEG